MKEKICKEIRDCLAYERKIGIFDEGNAKLECDDSSIKKSIAIYPHLVMDNISLQVVMISTLDGTKYIHDFMITPETMVNLAIVFNKYISEAFEDVKDELKQKGGSDA